MRTYHRWLSVFFGIFLLWIAITGVLSQVEPLGEMLEGKDEAQEQKATMANATPPGFVCPETMTCRPRHQEGEWNFGLMHHLHSGEAFGPLGTIIGALSGLAMIFFSFSGLWLYIQMWRHRKDRSLTPGWFWK